MRPHRPAIALSLLLALPAPPGAAQPLNLELPDIGDPSLRYISGDEERRLGLEVFRHLQQRGLVMEDVQINEYLAAVGRRIALYAEPGASGFTFFAVRDSDINAFATPGGYIGVHSGLVLATRSEDELAGVLAHEIAHVAQRHIARAIADTQRLSLPLAAAALAAILVAGAADAQLGQAALVGTLAAGTQRRINFTRANEQEADRVGSRLLLQAGYDPNALASFFLRLERLSGSSASQVPEYLLTHPLPASRAADTLDRQTRPPPRQTYQDKAAYFLARARLRVLTADHNSAAIRAFETALAEGDYADEAAQRYGYALALKRAGRLDEAEKQIQRLLRADPDRLAFRIEAAEIALAQGDRPRAWRLFEEARALYGDDYVLAIHYGQALAVQGDPRRALQVLEPLLRRRTGDAPLYALYAQAAQRSGDLTATHTALAEYYYLSGELTQAIEQAELGLKRADATPYQQARLRARLRQLKEEAAAEKRR
ncbi:MAG: M48 family metalloprotease [Pseudomonadota bacterium]|nr:M48 family metalloprotease [Pseudomonadota bacterium]